MSVVYKHIRIMLDMADSVGHVEDVDMSEWIPERHRILINGITVNGAKFKLELEFRIPKEEQND